MSRVFAVLGLGSNVGEREEMLNAACERLSDILDDMRQSSRYETPALLPAGAPREWDMPFLNMAVGGMTALTPQRLLDFAKEAEHVLGRHLRGHWAPREIDIDILAYGEESVKFPELTIPHPELLKRDFALRPFAELWPDWRHPEWNGTAAGWLKKLKNP